MISPLQTIPIHVHILLHTAPYLHAQREINLIEIEGFQLRMAIASIHLSFYL